MGILNNAISPVSSNRIRCVVLSLARIGCGTSHSIKFGFAVQSLNTSYLCVESRSVGRSCRCNATQLVARRSRAALKQSAARSISGYGHRDRHRLQLIFAFTLVELLIVLSIIGVL